VDRTENRPKYPETRTEVRVSPFLQLQTAMAQEEYNVIVVTHGCYLNDVSSHFNGSRIPQAGFCSITMLKMDRSSNPKKFRLVSDQFCGHLTDLYSPS